MRVVLAKPLTLALMRVVWRLASISYTSLVGMPLAWARRSIGVVILGSSSFLTELKNGVMKTGPIATATAVRAIAAMAPQIHQVRLSRRTIAKRPTNAME